MSVEERDFGKEVEKRLNNVRCFVKSQMDPGSYSLVEVVKVFTDERPRSWTEILEAVNVSKVSLSRKLKDLIKEGVLKRYVTASFPPSTRYALSTQPLITKMDDKGKVTAQTERRVSDIFVEAATELVQADRFAETIIQQGIILTGDAGYTIEALIEDYQRKCLSVLLRFLRDPQWSLWTYPGKPWIRSVAPIYVLLLTLGATVETLRLHPEVEALAEKLLEPWKNYQLPLNQADRSSNRYK